jgi:hypothetical protein
VTNRPAIPEPCRFTLPHRCGCGAHGRVTFEPRTPEFGKKDPHPEMVAAEGPFHLDDCENLICLGCGERLGRQPD